MKDNIDWNDCAPEILCIIFKYLDTKALSKCMLVNKKWKDIAEHTAEHYKLWEDIVKKEMINKGKTFIDKSVLDWRNIFKNSMLWYHVKISEIKHLKTYEIQGVKKMNIYKDNLILITGSHVLYYDIKTFTLIRSFETSCLNFEENDYSILELIQNDDLTRTLFLYIKLNSKQFYLDPATRHTLQDIRLYRLEDKLCYVLTATNILWGLTLKDTRWEIEFLGRYYGSDYDPITAIHVCNDMLYMVTKCGTVWYGDTRVVRLVKVHRLLIPDNVIQHNWVMFDSYSCVVPVTTNDYERVKVHHDLKSNVIMLECSELTCALQHGDVLFLGYNDGRVEIRIPKKSKSQSDPDRYFNIQQFYEHVDDSTIVSLNVCETINSHTLFPKQSGQMKKSDLECSSTRDVLCSHAARK